MLYSGSVMKTILMIAQLIRCHDGNSIPSMAKSPESTARDMSKTDLNSKCQERCETNRTEPKCSCDVRCRNLRNCCEDLKQVCPGIFNESLSRFEQTLHLLQECTPTGYLLVSGCPRDQDTDLEYLLRHDQHTEFVLKFKDILDGRGAVSKLFGRIPVTDMRSGLTFKNVSTYQCNTIPGKSPLFWDVYFDTFNLGAHGKLTYDELSQFEYLVYPPAELEKQARSTKCLAEREKLPPKRRAMLAANSLHKRAELYDDMNSYCDLCYKWNRKFPRNNEFSNFDRNKPYLPILASFEYNQFKFINHPNYDGLRRQVWDAIVCRNPENETEGTSVCSINGCRPEYVQFSETECKTVHVIVLAVPADEFSLSGSNLQRLSGFVQCFLSKYAGYDVIDRWNTSSALFDRRLFKIMYVTQLVLYWNQYSVAIEEFLLARVHYENLARLFKVLRSYRSKSKGEVTDKLTLQQMNTKESFGVNFDQVNFPNSKNIPMCANILGKSYVNSSTLIPVHLLCVNISVSMTDDTPDVSELNTCLQIFSGNSGNHFSTNSMLILIFLGTFGLIVH